MNKEDLKIEEAYFTGIHNGSFRPGEQAKIIGVEIVTPQNKEPRACFKVEYDDGFIDYKTISGNSYEIEKRKKEMIEIDGVEYEKDYVKNLIKVDAIIFGAKTETEPLKGKYKIEYEKDCYMLDVIIIEDADPCSCTHKDHGRYRKTQKNAEYSLERNKRANRLEALVEDLQGELGVGDCYIIYNNLTKRYGYRCEPNAIEIGIVRMKEETAIKICEMLNNEEYEL